MSSASLSEIAYLSRDLEGTQCLIFHFSHYFGGDLSTAHLVCVDPVLQPVVRDAPELKSKCALHGCCVCAHKSMGSNMSC